MTAGRLGVMRNGEWCSAGVGEHVEVPRGAIHTFRNDADEEVRAITGFEPSGFEGFSFEASMSEDSIRRVVKGCARFGMIIPTDAKH